MRSYDVGVYCREVVRLLGALCIWIGAALAVSPEALEARLQEIEPIRAQRRAKSAPKVSSATIRKVAAGGVVTGLNGSTAHGVSLVDVPIGRFWAALNDETRHPGYTKVAYSELVSGGVCASGREVLQYLPIPWISDRWWIGILKANYTIQKASGGAVRELVFSSSVDPAKITSESGKKIIAKAEPIGSSDGGWFLVAVDERTTYVEYHLVSDPGGSIPSSMTSMFATKGVKENIEAITRFAKEKTPSCSIK